MDTEIRAKKHEEEGEMAGAAFLRTLAARMRVLEASIWKPLIEVAEKMLDFRLAEMAHGYMDSALSNASRDYGGAAVAYKKIGDFEVAREMHMNSAWMYRQRYHLSKDGRYSELKRQWVDEKMKEQLRLAKEAREMAKGKSE
ncbi:MAG: hypothetical protein AB1468_04595 [Candidatus Micrarchaeota archaeon]